jgi:hypothetical protein
MRKIRKKKGGIKIPLKSILIGILLSLICVYIVYFLVSFLTIRTIDKAAENSSDRYLLVDDSKESRKTLVVIEKGYENNRKIEDVYVVITNKLKKQSLLIYLPGWLYYSGLEENFGNAIPVSSFRYAGDTLQDGRGVEYAIWQIGDVLGIRFNDYIYISSEAVFTFGELFDYDKYSVDRYADLYKDKFNESFYGLNKLSSGVSIIKTIFNPTNLRGLDAKIFSNMSFIKLFAFISGLNNSVKNTSTNGIDLSSYIYSKGEFVETGGQRVYINAEKFDEKYRGYISSLLDKDLEKERVRVEVYNGSGVSGAAMELGRKIENSGCDVVRYENAPTVEEKTLLYVSNKEDFPKSLETISSILSNYFVELEGRPSFMTTGDIVIILGEDIKRIYSF